MGKVFYGHMQNNSQRNKVEQPPNLQNLKRRQLLEVLNTDSTQMKTNKSNTGDSIERLVLTCDTGVT